MSFLFLKPDSSSQEYGRNIFTYTVPVQPGSIYYMGAVNTVAIYDKDYTSANGFLGEWAGGSNISSVAPYTLVLHSRAGATAQDWDGTIAYLPAAAAVAVAPTNAQYITLAADPTLTNERVLTAGSNITLNAGTPGVLTISAASGAVGAPTTAQYLTLATDPGLSNERVLTAGANVTLDAAVPGVLTINAAGGGAAGAPTTAEYLTLAADPGLANERVLTAGTNVTLDAAVPGVLTINSASSFANHKAKGRADGSQINSNVSFLVLLSQEAYDPGFNLFNSTYNAPSTGIYLITVFARCQTTATAFLSFQMMTSGGVALISAPMARLDGSPFIHWGAASDMVQLNAGQPVSLNITNSGLVAVEVVDTTGFAIHRLS